MASPYDLGLPKTPANYEQLTPIAFLERAADVHPNRVAIVHGSIRRTWAETHERSRRLASALVKRGVRRGDTVAVMLPNVPAMVEVHFGVPMAGAVLNTLNTRLDDESVGFMLAHAEAQVVLVDRELSEVVERAIARQGLSLLVVDVDDPEYQGPGRRIGTIEYEALLAEGEPDFVWNAGERSFDEWDAISLNYTSGTTGNPKGVVYHHRGAYLNAVSNALEWDMPKHPVYLWTLPMFHCNGWCFPWTVAARAGVNVCLRKVEANAIFAAIRDHRVTHYCGAPIVHGLLVNAPAETKAGIEHRVHAMVAGAAPPAALIEGMESLGFELTHVYGLTETYGPAAVCEKQEAWSELSLVDRAQQNARQGVRYHLQGAISVLDPETMTVVPADGETMGEVMFRGNVTMKGYLKNPRATEEAFAGGWFHTGDLGVLQPDGYVKIKDRSKDIIISGGENISSLEVEDALYRHPAVLAAAVVAKPDPKWGETPCAFVELRVGTSATAEELIAHCRRHLAPFKAPRAVVFGELPRTSTGKIQKFELRKRVGSATAIDV
ncbi:3-methylmercaptopropionyl-CoA ligase (DmdB) [Labilithrix luteola]|uniref:3-methylmercaptopropionyl-CoA ligase (DmdB) n=1 Tax=Labilithrix luteola TaxID=1391654 RepID=A0A0K1PKB8_9BACT|nr:acyl-CoA synthetase [Labilithrix luteola]AKU93554.1 3-methylmercaptopropionyl-CoA ligase (DmdB) [Labilithrix luteola]